MSYQYDGRPEYKPMSPWGYIGLTILYAIPVIGFIFLIIFSFHDGNINRRNFTRSYWCWLLVFVLLFLALAIFALVSKDEGLSDKLHTLSDTLQVMSDKLSGKDENNSSIGPSVTPSKPQPSVSPAAGADDLPQPTIEAKTNTSSTDETKTVSASPGGSTGDFKKTMDAYEAFFDDFIAFMQKYDEEDNISASMLIEYASMMSNYSKYVDEMDSIDQNSLSSEEQAYYLQVMARIEKKLIDYASNID